MSQELAKKEYNNDELQLITNTVAKGATPDELKLFLYTAQRAGLDPLTRQIHFVKRGNQMTIQTGIDGYRAIASRTGELAGIDDPSYDDETKNHPNKATVTVYRMVSGQRVAFSASARWAEYAPQGSQGFMWQKMPFLMLGKVAEALALRKAFPLDLSGLYTQEEMAQADNVIQHVDVEVTPVSNTQSLPPNQPAQKTLPTQTNPHTTPPKKTCPSCSKEHTGQYPTCYDCYMMKRNGITPKAPEPTPNDDTPPFP